MWIWAWDSFWPMIYVGFGKVDIFYLFVWFMCKLFGWLWWILQLGFFSCGVLNCNLEWIMLMLVFVKVVILQDWNCIWDFLCWFDGGKLNPFFMFFYMDWGKFHWRCFLDAKYLDLVNLGWVFVMQGTSELGFWLCWWCILSWDLGFHFSG